jgi:hypothetical protein
MLCQVVFGLFALCLVLVVGNVSCTPRCAWLDKLQEGPIRSVLPFKDVLTAEGTPMMQASWPRCYDEVGRGSLTQDKSGRP